MQKIVIHVRPKALTITVASALLLNGCAMVEQFLSAISGTAVDPKTPTSVTAVASAPVELPQPVVAAPPPKPIATPLPAAQNPLPSASVPIESTFRGSVADPNAAYAAKAAELAKRVFPGTGVLVKPPVGRPERGSGDIRFNFENSDIRDVVKQVITDILGENYIVDPQVAGNVTLRMSKGISRADLIPTLEVMLRQVNAVIVKDDFIWRIQPAAAGLRGIGRPNLQLRSGASGYGMTLVPLKYIGVNEMMRMLDALVKEPAGQAGSGGSARPEPLRNMLILSGTPNEVQYLLDTIEMFDVDWMSGMSVGLFTLEHSEAKKVLEEVDKVFGGLTQGAGGAPAAAGALGPMFGLVRVQLIERLNALLVISPQRHMIDQAEMWIRRLDRGGSADSSRMYVYNLQYTSAEKLAPVLQQAMQGRATTTPVPAAQTAPGQSPLTITTPSVGGQTPTSINQGATQVPRPIVPVTVGTGANSAAGAGTALARNATIIADKDRNALLIVATPAEYSAIEQALKKLDILPRQVMVEVTVIEVDLTNDFALGVEWAAARDRAPGTATARDKLSGTAGAGGLSFSLARTELVGNILNMLDATLNAKDSAKRARIHASPKLMAIDNTPVTFNVGRSVSVQTAAVTTVGGTTTANTTSNSYQYLQTGISVSITPRISAGGLVNLEITQEISEPTTNISAGGANPNPDISKTALKNTVLAQNGETIVMAGLIREKIGDGAAGVPGLSRIPVLGTLFGTQSYNVDKQELLVLVRPVVINSIEQSRDASDEMRDKMLMLRDTFGAKGIANLRPLPDAQITPSLLLERPSFRITPSQPIPVSGEGGESATN